MSSSSSQRPKPQPKIKLFWLNDSRAQRIVWLLEELGLEYDVETFQRTEAMQAPPELEKVHPLGKSPVLSITVPDPADRTKEKQMVLAESGFITQYLCDNFGQTTTATAAAPLLPKRYRDGQEGQVGGETDEWMRYQYYLHYAEGSLMPPVFVSIVLDILRSPKIPFFIRPITSMVISNMFSALVVPEISKHLKFLESQLETSPNRGQYLCGMHLTAADILLSFPLQLVREQLGQLSAGDGKGTLVDKFPKAWAYLKRLEQEPGYQRAEARIKELEKKI